jgi:hypothetical protein
MEALIEECIKAAVKMARKITEGYTRRDESQDHERVLTEDS